MKVFWRLASFLATVILIFSCGGTKELNYFQGQPDTTRGRQLNIPAPVIQKGDLISIVVYSDNPEATAIYNQPQMNSGVSGSGSTAGYLVNENGDIQFQGLGELHVEGLTKLQLITLLDSKLKNLLKNAYYNVRFINYRITVLGEVNSPGVYSIPSERVSILEALALAGDITTFGKKENVLVIREGLSDREFGRVDLTKPDIFSSPYFYLRQNDVLVIEATKKKATATDQATLRNVGIVTGIISTIAIVISVLGIKL